MRLLGEYKQITIDCKLIVYFMIWQYFTKDAWDKNE